MEPVGYRKQTAKIKASADELKSAWVIFPDNNQYLLPIVSRQEKLVPVFGDDGEVSLQVEQQDRELTALVAKFLGTVAGVQRPSVQVALGGDGSLLFTPESYADFIKLTRRLLLTNYDLSVEEVRHLLTMSHQQFGELVSRLILHLDAK